MKKEAHKYQKIYKSQKKEIKEQQLVITNLT